MQHETDRRVKAIWELHLNMELEQLRLAVELFRAHDEREPEELLPAELPAPVTFEPNKEYLRHLLDTQIDLTTLGAGYVTDAHERFEKLQDRLMAGELPASEVVVDRHSATFGTDYRQETEGAHPVSDLRQKSGSKA
jgi:hypothetical protein